MRWCLGVPRVTYCCYSSLRAIHSTLANRLTLLPLMEKPGVDQCLLVLSGICVITWSYLGYGIHDSR